MLTETFPLELVSPAFLAGADQTSAESCELRVATLRGQLRWWWRTLHAGWLDVPRLRALEAAVWGSTEAASPVRLSLTPVGASSAKLFDHKDGFKPKPDFKKAHNLAQPPNNKTTQGLFYLAYGMDENVTVGGQKVRKQRYYLESGGQWELRMAIQPGRNHAALIADQVRVAVYLLCRFGGVGSKARKGFGSFTDFKGTWDLDTCRDVAARIRNEHDFRGEQRPKDQVKTPAIDYAQPLADDIVLGTTDPWNALDRLGFAVQGFAQRHAHKERKEALGLPRKIHGPQPSSAFWLGSKHPYLGKTKPSDFRHAAPVHYHLARGKGGNLVVRAIAFPSPVLPDLGASKALLDELLQHIKDNLGGGTAGTQTTGPSATAGAGRAAPPRPASLLFRRGDRVATPEGDGTVDADVRIGASRVDVDFGDGDIGTVDLTDCTRLP